MKNLTWPNILSSARLGISVWIGVVAYGTLGLAASLFMTVFAFACIGFVTDWFDGWIARRWPSQQSALGEVLDPFADKMHVVSCMYYVSALGVCGWYEYVSFAIIVLREVFVTLLRGLGLGGDIPVSRLGKWKMGIQAAALLAYFLVYLVPELYYLAAVLLGVATYLTIQSGYGYIKPHLERLTVFRRSF